MWLAAARRTIKYYPKNLYACTFGEVIDGYCGAKKQLYIQALQQIKDQGMLPKDFAVKMFVKPDKYETGAIATKTPRAIQYRSPKFNLQFSRYIKPFEHYVYANVTLGNWTKTRAIVKGLNNYERAELFLEKVAAFRKPRFYLIDHAKFDSTIRKEHLRTTHRKYAKAFHSKNLMKYCRAQLSNKGYTKGGIVYKTQGTRMSGDPDTGLGNSVVNGDCLHEWLYLNGVTKYEIMLDGDDSIVIVEDGKEMNNTYFSSLGFETVIESTLDIQRVEFCKSRLMVNPRPCFIRNPIRTLSNTMTSLKKYPRHLMKDWVSAVGMCELACNDGIPVISTYGRRLRDFSQRQLFDEDTLWKMGNLAGKKFDTPIHQETREEFAQVWGVGIECQIALEDQFKTSTDETFIATSEIKRIKVKTPQSVYIKEYVRSANSFWQTRASYQSLVEFGSGCWWCSSETSH